MQTDARGIDADGQAIELLSVISGSILGVLLARRKHMDLVGVFSVGCITSIGGGTVRDVLLDRHPFFWLDNLPFATGSA